MQVPEVEWKYYEYWVPNKVAYELKFNPISSLGAEVVVGKTK